MERFTVDLSSMVDNITVHKDNEIQKLHKELDDTRTIIAYLRGQNREAEDELKAAQRALATAQDDRLRDTDRMNVRTFVLSYQPRNLNAHHPETRPSRCLPHRRRRERVLVVRHCSWQNWRA